MNTHVLSITSQLVPIGGSHSLQKSWVGIAEDVYHRGCATG